MTEQQTLHDREIFVMGRIDALVRERLKLTCEIEEWKSELSEIERRKKEFSQTNGE